MRPGTPPEALLNAIADGHAVLFLGAGFSHGVTGLDWGALIENLRVAVSDASGWDGLDFLDRAQLYVESQGREKLESEHASLLPSPDVLRSHVGELHRTLLSLPFPVIVTTNYDGMVEATLEEMDEPYRLIIDDDDVERVVPVEDGSRLVIKMHGDLICSDQIVLTRDDYLTYGQRRPSILALLQSLFLERTFLFYGFSLTDPNFLLLYTQVLEKGARARTAYALMKEPNGLLVQYWARRKVDIIAGNTFGDLERWVEGLHREAHRRHRENWDLATLLAENFPEHQALVGQVTQRVQAALTEQLARMESFLWVGLSPTELEDYAEEGEEVQAAFRVLRALERASLPIAPEVFASAAELLFKFGHAADARSAVDSCLRSVRRQGAPATPGVRATLGRVLCRLGELDRARPLLERALVASDAEDVPARTAELAWLTRCILDRADRLRDRGRDRATRELLGRFLITYSPFFGLAVHPAPTVEADEPWRWSLYYVNFRLGRLFSLSADLAGQTGAVYAQQAIEMLARAIELVPAKPEPYRVLRPLLLAPRGFKPDAKRWERIITAGPPDLQRKLQELEAQEARTRAPRRRDRA